MSLDPLEQRLAGLAVDAPDARRITAHVLSLPSQPRRRRAYRLPAVGLAAVAIAMLVIYFVPTAAAVLAGVPIAGDLLREAGLTGAAGQVTAVGAVSESSGFRLTLVGAYADSTRTVLLLRTQPAITVPSGDVTDQFGRTYGLPSGSAYGNTGDVVLEFEPLAWPDAITGARLTLRLSQVQSFYQDAASGQWVMGPRVQGSWTFGAILGVDELRSLAVPAAGGVSHLVCRFVSASTSSATVVVDIEVSGATPADLNQPMVKGDEGNLVFIVELIAPGGEIAGGAAGLSETGGRVVVHVEGYRISAGDYVLRILYQGDRLDRVLHVP